MIDFLKYRYISLAVSGLFIVAGGVSLVYNGGFRYSVDFTGGTQVSLRFENAVGSEALKEALIGAGWEDPIIREFGAGEVAIRVKDFEGDSQGLAVKIKDILENKIAGSKIEILEANAVGPAAGNELRWSFIFMILLGLLAMLLYIGIRFWSFSYGLGAIFSTFYDALAVLALFALIQQEISPNVVCAVLTILGYSINDTIIIFSRIRENFVKMKGESPEFIVNTSINQTLRRTILTSFATALIVGSLLIFGGESLHTFSFAMLFGIIVGTFSSIYIASPVMLMLRRASL